MAVIKLEKGKKVLKSTWFLKSGIGEEGVTWKSLKSYIYPLVHTRRGKRFLAA